MKGVYIVAIVAAVALIRITMFRRRRARRSPQPAKPVPASPPTRHVRRRSGPGWLGDAGIVAGREVRERIHGRIFRAGTAFILVAVAAAIIIPTLHSGSSGSTQQSVGIVGPLVPGLEEAVKLAGTSSGDVVTTFEESSLVDAKRALRSNKVDLVIIDAKSVLLNLPAQSSKSPADPTLVSFVAEYLGVLHAYRTANLTPAQQSAVNGSKAVPVRTLTSQSKSTQTPSVIGIVLLFLMLTQYCTWTLIGVMQEKSSRVVEVLLATLRPIQLLGGKVLGIGLVALGQATLIVAFALGVSAAVGSNLLHGSAPLALLAELLWLILGYAFYCWVYAAAGSMAERQDQVQTLALPLSIPILLGYIFSLTVASSGNVDIFFKVLAYLPPTAPFCMSVLVGLGDVTWWEFLASVLISIAGTIAMAVLAARIYRRAVLRTGARVHLRELFAGEM
ncbi:MAG: ABC transporter permease [Acidimicrobiales bacterium]